jgi:hypothetical protein
MNAGPVSASEEWPVWPVLRALLRRVGDHGAPHGVRRGRPGDRIRSSSNRRDHGLRIAVLAGDVVNADTHHGFPLPTSVPYRLPASACLPVSSHLSCEVAEALQSQGFSQPWPAVGQEEVARLRRLTHPKVETRVDTPVTARRGKRHDFSCDHLRRVLYF